MGKVKKQPVKKPKPKPKSRPVIGEVWTLADAAAYLRVDEAALQADAIAGRVPGQLVAGEWRFSRPGIVAWLGAPHRPNLLDLPVPDETPEEQEAFLEQMRAYRKGSGKVGAGKESAA